MADRGGIKRKTLFVTDKLNIFKMYDEKSVNQNQKEIAKEMDLPASTLRTILANRSKIESSAMTGSRVHASSGSTQSHRTRMRWLNNVKSISHNYDDRINGSFGIVQGTDLVLYHIQYQEDWWLYRHNCVIYV
ncbi:hypothetical protein QTP88_012146 [Uroleucon formosanum]